MGWRDLLKTETESETVILPWVGGRVLQSSDRTWRIAGKLPEEHGWQEFSLDTRTASWTEASEPQDNALRHHITGYLVGDRLVPDTVQIRPNLKSLAKNCEKVHLIEPGLDRFVRIKAGRVYESGPLIYEEQEFPLGPEDDVLSYFLDEKQSVDDIANVCPALDGAFRIETWHRKEIERRRVEEQIRREKEERRRKIREQLGDGALRREIAKENFEEAARAALAVGGAQYLDHRRAHQRDEMVVRFRFDRRRYECTCNPMTLQIIDSGICLTDHYTGEKGDTYFTLESLPGVIRQANNGGELVVFRHAN